MKSIEHFDCMRPLYATITGLSYHQVDTMVGHTRRDLKMDLVYPEEKNGKRYPCILWVGGGAWQQMDRSLFLAYLTRLALSGYVVATPDYRTVNETRHPGALQDLRAAIRYLRRNARRYHINTERFGVMGESAGGTLAALLALNARPDSDEPDRDGISADVQAACLWYAPADFSRDKNPNPRFSPFCSYASAFLGFDVATDEARALAESPLSLVTSDAPPFFLLHGTGDTVVPVRDSEQLYKRLTEAGCDATLLEIEGAGHADLPFFQDAVQDRVRAFFDRTLKAQIS